MLHAAELAMSKPSLSGFSNRRIPFDITETYSSRKPISSQPAYDVRGGCVPSVRLMQRLCEGKFHTMSIDSNMTSIQPISLEAPLIKFSSGCSSEAGCLLESEPAKGIFDGDIEVHPGMPNLAGGPAYTWFKKYLSEPIFYCVPALMWIALSARYGDLVLPTVANPAMEAGGLWGESKTQGFSLFGEVARKWTARYVILERSEGDASPRSLANARRMMRKMGLSFPVVVKPDRGYQGWGVRKIEDDRELAAYVETMPSGTKSILQEFVAYPGEAGIFYIRRPGLERGRILSMTLTYAAHVVGDGKSTLADLVEADRILRKSREIFRSANSALWDRILPEGAVVPLSNTRSARLGAVYRDARHLITPALESRIDDIAKDIDGFYFGRFDLRFKDVDSLRSANGFAIMELNGAGGEILRIWDGRSSLIEAYRGLWEQYRLLFRISAENQQRGARPMKLAELVQLLFKQAKLRKAYPPSS